MWLWLWLTAWHTQSCLQPRAQPHLEARYKGSYCVLYTLQEVLRFDCEDDSEKSIEDTHRSRYQKAMSGLEVLGVLGALAAASQLAEQGLKIALLLSELCKKVQDAPESIRKQVVLVQQLVDVCRLIESNQSLQTTAVASILRTCLLGIDQLQDILRKISVVARDGKARQLWKAFDGVVKEK